MYERANSLYREIKKRRVIRETDRVIFCADGSLRYWKVISNSWGHELAK